MVFSFRAASGHVELDPVKVVFNNSFPVCICQIPALIYLVWNKQPNTHKLSFKIILITLLIKISLSYQYSTIILRIKSYSVNPACRKGCINSWL